MEQPQVACRLHGPMRLDFARDSYVCKGFDGEGCERYLHNEELHLVMLLEELRSRGLMEVAKGPLYWTRPGRVS